MSNPTRSTGILSQLNISAGGMPKLPVPRARVTPHGIEGDWQKNRKYHGGDDRAVCIFSEELYAWLRSQHGIDLKNGSVGENFTTRGIDIEAWAPGDRVRVGACEIEITNVRVPCRSLDQWKQGLGTLIIGRSGWVAKVIKEGVVQPGDEIELVGRSDNASEENMTESFELSVDEKGKLTLKRPGADDVADVRVRRAFPWSSPSKNISIRSSEGKELLLIPDLQAVEPSQRKMVESWLQGASFVPRITRVDEVDVRFGYQQWKVQTDRGPIEFRVQEREDIRFMPDGRFSLKDADGNIYEMPGLAKLDDHSRSALESLV